MSLDQISKNILTQDNRCSHQPLFVVYQIRRIYGFNNPDNYVWLHDDGFEADPEETKSLESDYQKNNFEPLEWNRTGYIDIDVFVTSCFTEEGAKKYISVNGHNLKKPFIHAESLYRNDEMSLVREALKRVSETELDTKQEQSIDDLMNMIHLIKSESIIEKEKFDKSKEFTRLWYKRRTDRLNEWFRSSELKDTKMAYEWFSINANGHLMDDFKK